MCQLKITFHKIHNKDLFGFFKKTSVQFSEVISYFLNIVYSNVRNTFRSIPIANDIFNTK